MATRISLDCIGSGSTADQDYVKSSCEYSEHVSAVTTEDTDPAEKSSGRRKSMKRDESAAPSVILEKAAATRTSLQTLANTPSRKRCTREPPKCRVDGCGSDLSHLREYHKRYKICPFHHGADIVRQDGEDQRFCQKCACFHPLSAFDGMKRSCRELLQRHNKRRRRPKSGKFGVQSKTDEYERVQTLAKTISKANSSNAEELGIRKVVREGSDSHDFPVISPGSKLNVRIDVSVDVSDAMQRAQQNLLPGSIPKFDSLESGHVRSSTGPPYMIQRSVSLIPATDDQLCMVGETRGNSFVVTSGSGSSFSDSGASFTSGSTGVSVGSTMSAVQKQLLQSVHWNQALPVLTTGNPQPRGFDILHQAPAPSDQITSRQIMTL